MNRHARALCAANVTLLALAVLAATAPAWMPALVWLATPAAEPPQAWGNDAVALAEAPPDMDPVGRNGWAGPQSLKHSQAWAAQQPRFELIHPDSKIPVYQDNQRANVRLWDDVAIAAGGSFPPNIPQEIGDCTSWGAKHAAEATIAGQMTRGPPQAFRPVFAPFLYGAARVWIAKGLFGPGDGCNGAFLARAANEIGLLPADEAGVPQYSGAVARDWGRSGPPEQFRAVAAKYRVRTVAQLKTVDDVRDAICNRFGVTIASMWGTSNRAMRVQDGRVVAKRSGSWAHMMAIIGYDGSAPSGRKYFYILNSWGPKAHPDPIGGEPPGGFWVDESEVAWILRAEDTWAYSDFDGFPAQLDVSPLRPRPRR